MSQEVCEILLITNRLRSKKFAKKGKEFKQLQMLCQVIENNFPKFTAAGLYQINRPTILKILGSILSFFVVMVQFDHGKHC